MSGAHIRDGGNVLRAIGAVHVRDGGNVIRRIARAHIRDGGSVSRLMFGQLSAAASPASVTGAAYSKAGVRIVTNNTTVNANGLAPFSYAWTPISGWDVINPTSATTAFRSPSISSGGDAEVLFSCTVTDATGATATATVNASVVNTYGNLN